MKRTVFVVLVGILGTAVLLWLGTWQMNRLVWKENILTQIDARMKATPVSLPTELSEAEDKYLPVTATGVIWEPYLRVLTSRQNIGAGYRIISVLDINGRRVLLDRGFILQEDAVAPADMAPVTVVGNVHWPDETDSFTPEPDVDNNIWFARDVETMSQALQTEPVMIIASRIEPSDPNIFQMPIDTSAISNNHFNYAMTWFSLAGIWVLMSGFFVWRTRKQG